MRKKFFAMYALVGALVASPVFTSCIDGEESASVTAVRNAKAEQIKNATAIAQAKAEYDAKMNELNLAIKQMQVESDQIDLETKKANFEKVQIQVEQAIVQAKYNIAQYTKWMYEYQDQILTELTGNYTEALDDVVEYKEVLINKNADVAALEQGIVDIQEYVVNQTKTLNDEIAAAEAKIAIWKDAEGGINLEEVNAQIENLTETSTKLNAELDALKAEYGEMNFMSNSDDMKLATILAANKLYTINNNLIISDSEGYLILSQAAVTTYKQSADYDDDAVALENAKKTLADSEAALGTEADKADTKYQATATTKALTKYAELAKAKAELETAKKAYDPKKEAVDKAQAAYNEKKTAENEAQAALNANTDATKTQALTDALTAAQTATATAQTALTAAQTALTADIVNGYNNAVTAVANAELAIAQAIDGINSQKLNIVSLEATAKLEAEFETCLAAFEGDDYAAYKAAVDALTAKGTEITDVTIEIAALNALSSLTDVEALIAAEENTIAEKKAELEALKNATQYLTLPASNGYWINNIYYSHFNQGNYSEADIEAIISIVKEQIANLEIKIELAEKRAEQAKAALDAYLGTEGGEAEA